MTKQTLTRRQLLFTVPATAAAATLATAVAPTRFPPVLTPALADATSATFDLGSGIKITTITDGFLTLPSTFPAPNVDQSLRETAMAEAGQSGETYRSPINVTLISTPTDKILVDVGSGAHFMSTAGQLGANLDEAGIEREAITKVIYTHAHPDHIWGTFDEFDELTFPEASYHMSETEHAYWADPKTVDTLAEDRKSFGVGAKRNIDNLGEKLQQHAAGAEIVPGITLVDTSGHTPGHVSVRISAGDKTFMVLGDALNHPVISFQHPEWKPGSDSLKDKAVEMRKSLLDQLAADDITISGYHLPAGGIGRAVRDAKRGYVFETVS